MTLDELRQRFREPAAEFRMMPFWFWNDHLTEEETRRQIADFEAHGVGGFIIHARMGLSREVGYLTPTYFHHVRVAVEAAKQARRGMHVILYDEGMYPSGSAHGRVVEGHPGYAARGLQRVVHRVTGPWRGYWRAAAGEWFHDTLVAVGLLRENQDGPFDPSSLRLLEVGEHNLVRLDVGPGAWQVQAFLNVPCGASIRGVHIGEDDGEAGAPPAGDLLNPEATAKFLRVSHDAYAEAIGDYFGTTVIAMFTDEPGLLGRGARRTGLKPWTGGLETFFQAQMGYDLRPLLPALWEEFGPPTARVRADFDQVLARRLNETFYQPLSAWCEQHGLALVGHPAHSDDLVSLKHFQIPGQDTVWRWVLPDDPSSLEGAHSTAPKAASSAAHTAGKRRSGTECCGAYGWRFTPDEMKWLLDWHLVRGNNLFMPHAFYYSVRGPRAFERPPCLGPNNLWWPHFRGLADYVARVCALLTDGEAVIDVAVVCDGQHLPWRAAKELFQNQLDFDYVDAHDLAQRGTVVDGHLHVGPQRYRVVVLDGLPSPPPAPPSQGGEEITPLLYRFAAEGGQLVSFIEEQHGVGEERHGVRSLREGPFEPDLIVTPAQPDLRYAHVRQAGLDLYFVVNEGESELVGKVSLRASGSVEVWDPWTAGMKPVPATAANGRTILPLRLERRQGLVIAVDPTAEVGSPEVGWLAGGLVGSAQNNEPANQQTSKPANQQTISADWTLRDPATGTEVATDLGDWTAQREYETFAGTLHYETTFDLSDDDLPRPLLRQEGREPLWLDLGAVSDFAEVWLNDVPLGVRLWAPFRFAVENVARVGRNTLRVAVTNSRANELLGALRPSGLFGPVTVGTE